MTANSSDRSKVIVFDPKAKTGNYRRPDHNDFATTEELKKREFSGWRHNSISGNAELWVVGEIVKYVTPAEIQADPMAIEKAHGDYFLKENFGDLV